MFNLISSRAKQIVRVAATSAALVGLSLSAAPASAQMSSQTIYVITSANRLASFSTIDICKLLSDRPVKGLQAGEQILGIDFRPANGMLYALGSSSRLYTLDVKSGQATAIGTRPFSVTLSGSAFGFDFNPAVDRIRITSNSGQNLRAHPDTGAIAAVDGNEVYAGDAPVKPQAVGAAYTNPDTDPATPIALYIVDSVLDMTALQNPPNDGVLNIVGVMNLNATNLTGFDIAKSGTAYAAVLRGDIGTDTDLDLDAQAAGSTESGFGRACGTSRLVTVNLSSGVATEVGTIGTRSPVRGLAVPIQ